jgi:threonine synthase
MDISRPNNWPRVEALVKMQGWKLSDFDFGSLSDAQTETTMQTLYKKTGYIAEPHAAIAYQVLADNLKEGETGIFLGTAHPAKFKSDVDRILNIDVPLPKALADKVSAESKSVILKPDYDTLKNYVLEALNK